MWRSLFLAIGVSACILGVECMMIDKAIVYQRSPPAVPGATAMPATRDIVPPEWAPWTLLAAGAVVMLYSFTLPRKWAG